LVFEWLGMHISLCSKLLDAANAAEAAGSNHETAMAHPAVHLLTIYRGTQMYALVRDA
jgi:hypothetical protein